MGDSAPGTAAREPELGRSSESIERHPRKGNTDRKGGKMELTKLEHFSLEILKALLANLPDNANMKDYEYCIENAITISVAFHERLQSDEIKSLIPILESTRN